MTKYFCDICGLELESSFWRPQDGFKVDIEVSFPDNQLGENKFPAKKEQLYTCAKCVDKANRLDIKEIIKNAVKDI